MRYSKSILDSSNGRHGRRPLEMNASFSCQTAVCFYARLATRENKTFNFSQPGTDFRQIHVIFALFMSKRQRDITFKTLHVSQWFVYSFSTETGRLETFVNIYQFRRFDRLTPRSAPDFLVPYSVYSRWSLQFHTRLCSSFPPIY